MSNIMDESGIIFKLTENYDENSTENSSSNHNNGEVFSQIQNESGVSTNFNEFTEITPTVSIDTIHDYNHNCHSDPNINNEDQISIETTITAHSSNSEINITELARSTNNNDNLSLSGPDTRPRSPICWMDIFDCSC
jgi:hypothetical protein